MCGRQTTIRLIDVEDARAVAEHRSRDAKAFTSWEPEQPESFYTVEGQRDRIEQLLQAHRGGTTWPGVVLADGALAGQVTVSGILRQPFLRRASVGYWIGSVFQNEGHASRAVSQVLAVMAGELGLHRAEASTRLENLASQQVLRRNGFRPYGVAREHIFLDGEWRDGLLWELTLGP
jgi:ribosomal-protein-alanine N-acetyltransferase